ncbi:MAG: hypothetical protein FWB94_11390 [Chitinispirillia bacterium]|nr:hypothetical protein [Chitinispirillia bacterium]
MKKVMFAVLSVAIIASGAWAKTGFYAAKKGMVLTTITINAKGQARYLRSTVTDVQGKGGNMVITSINEPLGPDRMPLDMVNPFEMTVNIVDGAVELVDGTNALTQAFPDAKWDISFSGDKMYTPANMKPGDKFRDLHMATTMSADLGELLRSSGAEIPEEMGSGIIRVDAKVVVTGYQCLAIEKIKVPAGTFKAYKTTKTNETAMTMSGLPGVPSGTQNTTTTTVTWSVKGIGTVRRHIYDADGKLSSAMELLEIKR